MSKPDDVPPTALPPVASGPSAVPPPPVGPKAGAPKEIGGPPGPEPTRYGDWQYKGRCTDF